MAKEPFADSGWAKDNPPAYPQQPTEHDPQPAPTGQQGSGSAIVSGFVAALNQGAKDAGFGRRK